MTDINREMKKIAGQIAVSATLYINDKQRDCDDDNEDTHGRTPNNVE